MLSPIRAAASAHASKQDLGLKLAPVPTRPDRGRGPQKAWRERESEPPGGRGRWRYVSTCAVEGMETNSRRMFLAISMLFCAIISAFWMSW